MVTVSKQRLLLFVDKSSRRWVVRDSEGDFWIVPPVDEAWEQREPFIPLDENELERVPDHYRYVLGLPE